MIRLGDGFQDWNPLKERNSRDMRIIIVRPELGEVMQMSVTKIVCSEILQVRRLADPVRILSTCHSHVNMA